jgi:hypothetical protein
MCDFIHELKNDHRVIQQVVAGMSAVAELLDSGKQVDPSVLADLVRFLRVFADQCHHEKEEQHLFPLRNGLTIQDCDESGRPAAQDPFRIQGVHRSRTASCPRLMLLDSDDHWIAGCI